MVIAKDKGCARAQDIFPPPLHQKHRGADTRAQNSIFLQVLVKTRWIVSDGCVAA